MKLTPAANFNNILVAGFMSNPFAEKGTKYKLLEHLYEKVKWKMLMKSTFGVVIAEMIPDNVFFAW